MPNRIHPVVLVVENNPDEGQAIRGVLRATRLHRAGSHARPRQRSDRLPRWSRQIQRAQETSSARFRLIDLDVADANAFEILEWLQNKPQLRGIRTVIMTTGENVASMNRAYQLGAASFITKPLNFSEFRDTIQSLYTEWSAARKSGAVTGR